MTLAGSNHLDCFGVAVAADLPVGRVLGVAAGVAGGGLAHCVDLAEGRLDAPEASGREGRAVGSRRPLPASGGAGAARRAAWFRFLNLNMSVLSAARVRPGADDCPFPGRWPHRD